VELDLPKALIVDDIKDNITVFKAMLGNHCHHDTAINGIEALEMMKSGHYDVVFMDVKMPGMDGNTTIKHFREWEETNNIGKRTPIAVVSASAYSYNEKDSYDAGCDVFLTKPIGRELLLKTLHNLVSKD
jgi:CheY-like chemotaxis protein